MTANVVDAWLAALKERHLADLTSAEVARALRALSSCYVERRDNLSKGGALDGAGKRAAFALFYGPHHFLVTREIAGRVRAAPGDVPSVARVIDLGCGTGAAGAAAALASGAASIEGLDVNPWAVREANWTYQAFGLRGRASVSNIGGLRLEPGRGSLVVAAYAINELTDDARAHVLGQLLAAASRGAAVLVVEPIARRANRWWGAWAAAATAAGGRDDEWRFAVPLPPRQRALAKAAGLDVQELTARSLWLPGTPRVSE